MTTPTMNSGETPPHAYAHANQDYEFLQHSDSRNPKHMQTYSKYLQQYNNKKIRSTSFFATEPREKKKNKTISILSTFLDEIK